VSDSEAAAWISGKGVEGAEEGCEADAAVSPAEAQLPCELSVALIGCCSHRLLQ
jgi:hypothetical protein